MRGGWYVLVVGLCACGRLRFDDVSHGDGGGDDDAPPGSLHGSAYIKASNTGQFDMFGTSVALSSDGLTLAVGAPRESSGATGIDGDQSDDSVVAAGAVYVFVRAGASWIQQAYVKPSITGTTYQFGTALALSMNGDTLVVGAPGESAGAVYAFARAGATWNQQARIVAASGDTGDLFGSSVALSGDGNTLAVGAMDESSAATGIGGDEADNSAASAGAAYVFARTGTSWNQQAYVKATNTDADDKFGQAIALTADGNTLAVGAPNEASGSTSDQGDNTATEAGAVYVYVRAGTTWSVQAYVKGMPVVDGDFFGYAVALDGDTLAAGAPGEDSVVVNSGGMFVATRSGAVWTQHAVMKASNPASGGQFGSALALAGQVVVCDPAESSAATGLDGDQSPSASAMNSGACYAFVGAAQTTYIKASNTGADDMFGIAVALTSGNVLAIGASQESSGATGIDGDQSDDSLMSSGAVYVSY